MQKAAKSSTKKKKIQIPCLCTSLKLLKSKDKREDYKSSEKKAGKKNRKTRKVRIQ